MIPRRRLFFALWPPAAWCVQLLEAAAPLLNAADGRAVARDDLHVTLCFLGAVDPVQHAGLCERAAQIGAAAFQLEFERLEIWREAGIVAATVAQVPAAGRELAHGLAAAARQVGLAPDARPWRPHMTLMRGSSIRRQPAQGTDDAGPSLRMPLAVSRFYLAESQGLGAQTGAASELRRYASLASWPLRP
jgi:2'-5' RNA ligase